MTLKQITIACIGLFALGFISVLTWNYYKPEYYCDDPAVLQKAVETFEVHKLPFEIILGIDEVVAYEESREATRCSATLQFQPNPYQGPVGIRFNYNVTETKEGEILLEITPVEEMIIA